MVKINNVSSIWQTWLHLVIVTLVYLQVVENLTVRYKEMNTKFCHLLCVPLKFRLHNCIICLHTFLLSPSAESVLEAMLRLGRGGYSYSGEQSPSSGIS
jgi:hypothetical protein